MSESLSLHRAASRFTANRDPLPDLPPWFSIACWILGTLLLVLIPWMNFQNPEGFATHLAKDVDAGSSHIVEHLTVVVLLPGIAVSVYALLRHRGWLSHPVYAGWLGGWALACIYFAGEEISWGQWIFHWESPEWLQALNDQGETNLHNMTSWLDQKPRAVVEAFILGTGIVTIFWRWKRPSRDPAHPGLRDLVAWVLPPTCLLPTILLFAIVRACDWFPRPGMEHLGNSELREFVIACFLGCYLVALALRPLPDTEAPKRNARPT